MSVIYLRCHFLIFLCFSLLPSLLFCLNEPAYDPLAVYLTWQKSPEKTMTIHWISDASYLEDVVNYRALNQADWDEERGSHQPLPGLPGYYVHTAELTQLTPNTDYSFRISSNGVIFKFRTMPSLFDFPIRFVVGGDFYHDSIDLVIKTNKQAARKDPHFALVGGDIAYSGDRFGGLADEMHSWMDWIKGSDNKTGRRIRWIHWLIAWKEHMVTPDGRLIPFVPVLGNHDINGGFNKSRAEAADFHALFAMPGEQGYNVLDFGNYLTLFLLDSGHTNSIGGKQTHWLYESLRSRQKIPHKFAIYHVPAYPSYRRYNNKISASIRLHWVPLFDLFGLHAAFEHHDHTYKRTHPLRNGKVDPIGMLYLGDGAWGVETPRTPKTPEQAWYLAKTASRRHFILVTINKKNRQFKAIDDTGKVIDVVNSGFFRELNKVPLPQPTATTSPWVPQKKTSP